MTLASLRALILPVLATALSALAPEAAAQCPSSTVCPAETLGAIESPVENALVSGFVPVKGFALDGNLVSNIDLYIDGTDEVNRITPQGGANINLPRPDLLQLFPSFYGTPGANPGFQISFRAANYSNGVHTLFVRVTDVTGCCYFLAPRRVRIDNNRNQPPFGALDFPRPDSYAASNGVIAVTGWALDDRKVDHVEIYVDGLQERQAVVGIYRADVAGFYPGIPEALFSGYIMHLDSTRYSNGVHQVTVKAVDDQGQVGLLGDVRVAMYNNASNLPPFGEVEFPLLNASWFGNCFEFVGGPSGGDIIDPRYVMYVQGWALDTSQAVERGGVSHVIVEIDGVEIKDSRVSCHREFNLNNILIDCYGFYRRDIEVLYPGFQQAPYCGYRFAIDVGYLVTVRGFREGAHILQVILVDKEDQRTELKTVPIYFECATANLDPPPIGDVEDPTHYKYVNGVFLVKGWALDLDTVQRVRILIDGIPQIDAVRGVDYAEYGLPSNDIAAIYPNYFQAARARFQFYLDTTKLSNSEHDLLIEVIDGRGVIRSAGTRRFIVNNNTVTR